jgi:peptidoglycan/LPS O-acetylase OafA/YrhL
VAPPAIIEPRTAPGEKLTATPGGHLRLPVLDGVRGLAILMVIACHATMLPKESLRLLHAIGHWGTTGVDGFFVLSGFLITGILYEAKGARNYFRNFYARRILRIFPLYYACVIFGLLVFPYFTPAMKDWLGGMHAGNTTWTYWVYLANFSIGNNYGKVFGYLDSTWSLAIEEQFYFVWPLLVLLLSRKQLMGLCLALIATALLTRTILVWHGVNWFIVFTNTFCRMDCLAAGSFVALAARGPGGIRALRKWAIALFIIGAIGIVEIIHLDHWNVGLYSGLALILGYGLIAVFYASGITLLLNASPRSWAHRLFAGPVLSMFGRYSYAMYLLHGPVLRRVARLFCDNNEIIKPIAGSYLLPQILLFVLAVLGSLGVALVSWYGLESHCLSLKRYFRDEVRAAPSSAAPALS